MTLIPASLSFGGPMSHTDKTDPYWVTSEFYVPAHWRCPFDWRRSGYPHKRECDLPQTPVRINPLASREKFPAGRCHWESDWPNRHMHRYVRVAVPKWYRDHVWTNAERVRMRSECRVMTKEFNSDGRVIHEPQSWQHRHMAAWRWI